MKNDFSKLVSTKLKKQKNKLNFKVNKIQKVHLPVFSYFINKPFLNSSTTDLTEIKNV